MSSFLNIPANSAAHNMISSENMPRRHVNSDFSPTIASSKPLVIVLHALDANKRRHAFSNYELICQPNVKKSVHDFLRSGHSRDGKSMQAVTVTLNSTRL